MVVMTKQQQNTLALLLILLLLYYVFVYSKTMAKTKTKSNGNGNGNGGITPSTPEEKKYRCDAGGCLECDPNNTHSSCVSLAQCQEQCSSQIQSPVQVAQNDVIGCMDNTQLNYDPNANVPCNRCCIPALMGCNDPSALNYNPNVSTGWGCISNDPNIKDCCIYVDSDGNIYGG